MKEKENRVMWEEARVPILRKGCSWEIIGFVIYLYYIVYVVMDIYVVMYNLYYSMFICF